MQGRPQGQADRRAGDHPRREEGEGKDVWEGGKILDPENGREYTLRLTPIEGGRSSRCAARSARSAAPRPGCACSNLSGERPMYKEHEERGQAEPGADSEKARTMSRFQVKKVAVLGAGVMGAQIAAHLVNVKVPVVLFDLPAKEGPKNGIVTKAVEGPEEAQALAAGRGRRRRADRARPTTKSTWSSWATATWSSRPSPSAWTGSWTCTRRSRRFIAPHAIVASNTSGLSITKLSEALPEAIKPRFCGIHFFNPPRYMYLVELIATPTTDAAHPGRPGDLRHQRAGQGRGARQGHAQLHRQPRRHRRHAGDDAARWRSSA